MQRSTVNQQHPIDPTSVLWAPTGASGNAAPSLSRQAGPKHSRPPHGCAPNAIKLFVGNIPKHYTEEQLMPLFESVGKVVELAITRDKASKASKGSAFVWYATGEAAEAAIRALNNRHALPEVSGKEVVPLAVRPATIKAAAPRPEPSKAAAAARRQLSPKQPPQLPRLEDDQLMPAVQPMMMMMPQLQQHQEQQQQQQQPQQLFYMANPAAASEPAFAPTPSDLPAPPAEVHYAPLAPAVTLSMVLPTKQLLELNQHLYSIHAMSGAHVNTVPLPDSMSSLVISGSEHEVEAAKQMLALLLAKMVG